MRIQSQNGGEPYIVETRLILNDMTARGVGLFVPDPILVGQEVSITLEYPRPIFLKGRVYACVEVMASGRVVSEVKCAYRLGIEFVFDSEEEEAAIREFAEDLYQTVLFKEAA